MSKVKYCPECGENIENLSNKCCMSYYSDSTESSPKLESGEDPLGLGIILVPIIGILLIYYWVGNMNLMQNPSSSLHLIVLGTIGLTSFLIYVDSSKLGMGKDDANGKKTNGASQWAVFSLFLWIVGYPAYLFHRVKFGAKDMALLGVIIAFIFTMAAYTMNEAIEDKKEGIRESFRNW
ncbi:MAG: hypothetical protein HRT89_22740 [Lentisphaeria bacterium]|nr:hypothetical protein [Lentisphaeria bacterium]